MNIQAGANINKQRALRQMSENDKYCDAADSVPSKAACINASLSDTFSAKCGFNISTLVFDTCGVLKAIHTLPKQQRKTNHLNMGFIFDVFCLSMAKT